MSLNLIRMYNMETTESKILQLIRDPGFRDSHLFGKRVVKEVEDKLRHHNQKEYALMFPNATTSIWAVCFALNIRSKAILTSPFGWGGAIAPFLYLDNKVVFCKTDSLLNIDANSLNRDRKNLAGIFSVDVGGFPAATKQLKDLTHERDTVLIADVSQSFGAYLDGKPAGYFADITILSFTSTKMVNCLEGGAVLTNDKSVYEKLVWFSQHPYRQKAEFGIESYNEFPPLNGRINPVSAWILNSTFDNQLKSLRSIQERYFALYERLVSGEIIKPIAQLSRPEESTYFDFLTEPVSDNGKLFPYLNKKYPDFQFSSHSPVPFDKKSCFQRDFKNAYSGCSSIVTNRLRIKLKA